MSLCVPAHVIEVAEPDPAACPTLALPPEGNVKLRNYRVINEHIRAYTPTGDVHTSPSKGKVVSRYDVSSTISPPRARILELVRPDDEGCEALEAIVRPAPRRGLTRPLDEDTRRFLQRVLHSPSPYALSAATSPEVPEVETRSPPSEPVSSPELPVQGSFNGERSLAEELREAEEEELSGVRRPSRELRGVGAARAAVERERLGRLALAVEAEGEGGAALGAAARRLDALLVESRALHAELAAIHRDLQTQSVRACRCAEAARALVAESRALRYLDDIVALLRGDVAAAGRARQWPFAIGNRQPERNYVI